MEYQNLVLQGQSVFFGKIDGFNDCQVIVGELQGGIVTEFPVANFHPHDNFIVNIDISQSYFVLHDVECGNVVFIDRRTKHCYEPIKLKENCQLMSKCMWYLHYKAEEKKKVVWFMGRLALSGTDGTR